MQSPDGWRSLWRSESLEGLSPDSSCVVYEHVASGIRACFLKVTGPLVGLTIFVPTASPDDCGLPHCTEHLVFLGCESRPQRGYLDILASRCLCPGTNAVTTEDHTAYTVCTAGAQGMLRIVPEYLNHVLHPTFDERSLLTEIFHVDESAEEGGVVYCELLGRENCEADLAEYHLHKMAFPGSPYGNSSGGQTAEIAAGGRGMSRERVVEFHRRFYSAHNVTVLLQGAFDETEALQAIGAADLPKCRPSTEDPQPWSEPVPPMTQSVSRVVPFPCDAESAGVGSVSLGWRGPHAMDVRECVAIEVLCRYLGESSASPLLQRFVERDCPLACDVDIGLVSFKETLIELTFYGVPKAVEAGHGKRKGRGKPQQEMLLEAGVLREKLFELLRLMKTRGMIGEHAGDLAKAARRHLVKLREDLEDEPQNTCEELLAPDFVFGNGSYGGRLRLPSILGELQQEPETFWVALLDRWILCNKYAEVVMTPDSKLHKKISKDAKARRSLLASQLGNEGLETRGARLREAQEFLGRPLGSELLATLPDVPTAESVKPCLADAQFVWPSESSALPIPLQLLRLNSQFVQVRLCTDLKTLPPSLRPYLVLFKELLGSCPVARPGKEIQPYTSVVQELTEDLISTEGGVGFGSSTFSCSSLSDVFSSWFISEPEKAERSCQWLSDLLRYTVFTEERIETVASNLLSAAEENSRDGASLCDEASLLLMSPTDCPLPNDVGIGVLVQKSLLSQVLKDLPGAVSAVESIRAHLSRQIFDDPAAAKHNLIQVCLPHASADVISLLSVLWPQRPKQGAALDHCFALPYVQPAMKADSGRCVVVPVSGVESSFVQQLCRCSISKTHEDFCPVLVLCELLSRTEGPLFKRVRGPGMAYDASAWFDVFHGTLCLSLHECSEPLRALQEFRDILDDIAKSPEAFCSPFLIASARSSLWFQFFAERSTVPVLTTSAVKGVFKGFVTPDLDLEQQLKLDKVTMDDVTRVFKRYFSSFLCPDSTTTVLVVGPSEAKKLTTSLSHPPLCLPAKIMKLSELSSSIDITTGMSKLNQG